MVSEASLKNLRPWQPGQSGNPNGLRYVRRLVPEPTPGMDRIRR
jgi:hypothetical protein